ncbi:hypothetical protein KA005_62545 [bacterium]|nr:hypothetical protein [bacterium]
MAKSLAQKEKEAIGFLKKNCKGKGPIQLCNSGGKDSIVTADIFKKSGLPYVMAYSDTGIDPPEVLQFIKANYPECIINKPTQPFFLAILGSNPPYAMLDGAVGCSRSVQVTGWA